MIPSSGASGMQAIIVPIKEPTNCKTRLASLLTPPERERLAWAMYTDVTAALAGIISVCPIFIVTSFDKAAEYARGQGFEVLPEESQSSESASVDRASAILASRGFLRVLRIPADIPLVRGADLASLLSNNMPAPGVLIVPSRDGTGTNAILRTPPDLFQSRFGPNSLALHLAEAARVGATHSIVTHERIALDIDEPEDIQAFLAGGAGTSTETLRVLTEMNVAPRLSVIVPTPFNRPHISKTERPR